MWSKVHWTMVLPVPWYHSVDQWSSIMCGRVRRKVIDAGECLVVCHEGRIKGNRMSSD